jgi:predicted N-acyltransferase
LVADNNPFLQHAFLDAMEQHRCVGPAFGWLPRHIAIHEGESLVAAMPLYEKHNSYGEFVFDNSWAEAYQRAGIRYFPKLVAAIPYTPATGQRFLIEEGREKELSPLLLQTALQLAESMDASSFHCLFQPENEHAITSQSLLTRHDCQFHWHNRGYADFETFLGRLTAKKRKNIRQERRRLQREEVQFRILDGHSATTRDWEDFSIFYQRTFDNKWGMATFNREFFVDIAAALPDQVVLVLADREGECIAGALMYRSDSTLYGRHWGCTMEIDFLHFETCYYQGIEYCIRHGIARFEPGAQGEHKIARGFVPVLTRSSHWLKDDLYRDAIQQFCLREQAAIADYMAHLQSSLPYRNTDLP